MRHISPLSTVFGVAAMTVAAAVARPDSVEPLARAELEQVIVTATRLPRPSQDIAGTVTVISAQEIEQQLSDDLDDLVRYQPGVSMNTAGRGGNQGFAIRGIDGNRVLLVVDGIRSSDIYSAGPSSYGKDAFEIDDLKAAEIIRGPASVFYGADALGGAVVLRTKGPGDYIDAEAGKNTHLALRAAGSSADEHRKLGFTAAAGHDVWGFMARYTRRDFHESELEGPGTLDPQDGWSDNLMLKSVWRPSAKHQLTATFDTQQEEIGTRLVSELGPAVTRSLGRDETDRYRISASHHWQLQSNVADHVDTLVYWQDAEALQHTAQRRADSYSFGVFVPGIVDRVTDFEFNQNIRGLGATAVKAFATAGIRHTLVYGFSWDSTDTERPRNRCETDLGSGERICEIRQFFPGAAAEVFPNKTFPDTETERTGVYLQDEIILGRGLALIPGLRYDRYKLSADLNDAALVDTGALGFNIESMDEGELSASLGVIYELDDTVALFAQYAEGFRAPNFDEANQSFVNLAFRYATVPNPDLKPETSRGYEVGIKSQFDNAHFSVALFDNHYDDFIDTRFIGLSDSGISIFQQLNLAEARIYGAEMSIAWKLNEAWQLRGALAYARGSDERTDAALDQIEPLNGVLGMAYAADFWGVETVLTLVDKKDRVSAADRVTAAGYGLVDIIGHYDFSDTVGLRIGVLNLFNKQYARWTNIDGLAVAATGAVARAQEPGTEFRVGLEVEF